MGDRLHGKAVIHIMETKVKIFEPCSHLQSVKMKMMVDKMGVFTCRKAG